MKNGEVHSEEWMTDAREFWWNNDYINLLISRYNLKDITSIADIGCGKGYMTYKFLPYLNKITKSYGIDMEESHIKDAIVKTKDYSDIEFNFKTGDAENLELPSNISDFTVCQTLLLHLNNPLQAIKEMKRITKNCGLVMAIETNNSVNSLIKNSYVGENTYEQIDDIEKTINQLKFDLTIQKGIYKLNEGFVSLGDYVPKLFLEAGLKDIQVSIVDKATSLIPPYDTIEKKSRAKELLDWIDNSDSEFNYNQMLKYYLAGDGTKGDFDKLWKIQEEETQKIKKAILEEKYIMPGGSLMYIITGRK